jgi:hypothetical protein
MPSRPSFADDVVSVSKSMPTIQKTNKTSNKTYWGK